jgi:hypothetical protein
MKYSRISWETELKDRDDIPSFLGIPSMQPTDRPLVEVLLLLDLTLISFYSLTSFDPLGREKRTMVFFLDCQQGVTKRCRHSWLTHSALVKGPKWGGGGMEGLGVARSQPIRTLFAIAWRPNKLWR